MSMAVGPGVSLSDGAAPVLGPAMMPMPAPVTVVSDAVAKDAIIGWYKGEFAAANAIIDALCGHLAQLSGGGDEYASVFAAIHRRRINWIPVLQMQNYHSIADVMVELRNVGSKKVEMEDQKACVENGDVSRTEENCKSEEVKPCLDEEKVKESDEKVAESNGIRAAADEVADEEASPDSEITDAGSQEAQLNSVNEEICSNHDECEARRTQIKLTKGFSAKESVKGHMVNVVKGLKLYEDIFADTELCKLTDLVNDLHAAGINGELSGETFILFNKQVKGNRRELIQFGVPIFGQIKEDTTSNIVPIPALLDDVIDHFVLWQLIPEYKRPNGCMINFFEEGEYSQPFLKPPHLDQPIATLLLSESAMAFGRTLLSDNDGNYKGPLMLSLKQGSLFVVYRVGDLDRTIKFYTECLGMKLLRKRDIPEERYTNAFLGYGPEDSHFVIELTYNYGVDKYDIGTAFGHFGIAVEDVAKTVELIKAKGGKVTREPGPVKGGNTVIAFVEDPDGYKFELLERGPTPEPLCQVMLRVGDLDRSITFYEKAFGMELLCKRDNPEYKYTIAMMGYGPEDKSAVLELTYNYGVTEYNKGNAYAQIAIGTDDVYKTAEGIKLCGGKITREPGPLPGLNTKITACLDPDGWKSVFVDNVDFLKELE